MSISFVNNGGLDMKAKIVGVGFALVFVTAATAAAAFAGSSSPVRSADAELNLVAYSTPREAYGKLIPMFQKTPEGKDVTSRSPTAPRASRRARSRPGLKADIVALSLAPDVDELVEPVSSTRSGRSSRTRAWSRTRSSYSSCATATRRRSRRGTTSCRPGVEVITPNPFTSGGARWNVMAAYGAWRQAGQDRQAGAGQPAQAVQERRRPGQERSRRH